jgi:hypothetical protein
MNTRDLHRQRLMKPAKRTRAEQAVTATQDSKCQQRPTRTINATAHTGEPSRSFKMQFQYEEAARYRSQQLREQAERARFLKDAQLAQRMRQQGESSARRARRALAGLMFGN